MDLDKKDRRLLSLLDRDARMPYTQLAKQVSLSQEGVRYRVERLQDTVIKDYVTVLNHNALGRRSYRIFFKFQDRTSELEKRFVDIVRDHAAWFVRVRGEWSFNTMFFADDEYAVKRMLDRVHEAFPEAFLDNHVSLVTRIYHYPRRFFHDGEDQGETQVMGDPRSTYDVDEKDRKILKSLRRNARQKTVEVARDIDVSERVVRYRMKQMEEADVILAYRALPDLPALGRLYYKVHFQLNKQDEGTRRRVQRYAEQEPTVTYLTEAVGGPDLELEYQVESSRELYEKIDALIADNTGLIRDYNVLLYDKEYQLSYFNKITV